MMPSYNESVCAYFMCYCCTPSNRVGTLLRQQLRAVKEKKSSANQKAGFLLKLSREPRNQNKRHLCCFSSVVKENLREGINQQNGNVLNCDFKNRLGDMFLIKTRRLLHTGLL